MALRLGFFLSLGLNQGCCVFAAFVRGDNGDTVHDDATWLLDFYDTFRDCLGNDVLDLALNSLANVEGTFGEYFMACSGILLALHCRPDSRAQGDPFEIVWQDKAISTVLCCSCCLLFLQIVLQETW